MILRKIWKANLLETYWRHLKSINRTCQSCISGMELSEVVERLKNYAPLSLAEGWDNVGLLVEPSTTNHLVSTILLTNDLTEAVMDEAINKNTNMIFTYHPPIFSPLKALTKNSWKERVILKAVENKIAIYSPHTTFDVVKGGVTDWLASGLGSGTVRPLKNTLADGITGTHSGNISVSKEHGQSFVDELVIQIKQIDKNIDVNVKELVNEFDVVFNCDACSLVNIMKLLNEETQFQGLLQRINIFTLAKVPLEDTGVGRIFTLEELTPVETIVKRIKDHLKLDNIRFARAWSGVSPSQKDLIKTVAICAGSGGSVLKGVKADMYFTGEMSHHDVLNAVSNGTHVILGEHSNTERGFLKDEFSKILYDMLEGKINILDSKIDVDPIKIV